MSLGSLLSGSSIHGLSHLTPERSPTYRLVWLATIALAVGYGGSIIFESWRSWNESPVLTTMHPVPIKDIPLPGRDIKFSFFKDQAKSR